MKLVKTLMLCSIMSVCLADRDTQLMQFPGITIPPVSMSLPNTIRIEPTISSTLCYHAGGLMAIAAGLSMIATGFKRATKAQKMLNITNGEEIYVYPNAKSGVLLASFGTALAAGGIWAITR